MEKRTSEILARLRAQMAIAEAGVRDDPLPALRDAERRITEMYRLIDRVDRALTPDLVYDFAMENDMRPDDVCGREYLQVKEAARLIREYFDGGREVG